MRKATLHTLEVLDTNDWSGRDELRIVVFVDNAEQEVIQSPAFLYDIIILDRTYLFNISLNVFLEEEDTDNSMRDRRLFEDWGNEWLGTVTIENTAQNQVPAIFYQGNAEYILSYSVASAFEMSNSVGQNGVNTPNDVLALKQRLIELGFNWLTVDTQINNALIQTINLFQSIIRGRDTVQGDGRVDVPGFTYQWLRAVNAPHWQLMPASDLANGFENFERAEINDNHDYGTDWMAGTTWAAWSEYRRNYFANHMGSAPLSINDVSLPRGGDTPDHDGHETGLGCDIRLPRTDGSSGGITWNSLNYDQAAMRAMLRAIRNQPLWERTFFNDPQLINENLCVAARGHDNHAHFEIHPPARID